MKESISPRRPAIVREKQLRQKIEYLDRADGMVGIGVFHYPVLAELESEKV